MRRGDHLAHIHAGDLPEQGEHIHRGVDHMADFTADVRWVDQGAGHDQRYPHARLVGRALAPLRIKGQSDGLQIAAVIPHNDHHRVGGVGVIGQPAVGSAGGEAQFNERPANLLIHRFDHLSVQEA
jgi:hypothetical protein